MTFPQAASHPVSPSIFMSDRLEKTENSVYLVCEQPEYLNSCITHSRFKIAAFPTCLLALGIIIF